MEGVRIIEQVVLARYVKCGVTVGAIALELSPANFLRQELGPPQAGLYGSLYRTPRDGDGDNDGSPADTGLASQ